MYNSLYPKLENYNLWIIFPQLAGYWGMSRGSFEFMALYDVAKWFLFKLVPGLFFNAFLHLFLNSIENTNFYYQLFNI